MDAPAIKLVVLLTDFGVGDPWVASMKAAVYSINPAARIIDLTHSVAPHDIFGGGFSLYRSYMDFPPDTIFLCVVDPGVGSDRRAILVRTDNHFFVGPDNGLFSFIYAHNSHRVVSVENDDFFRKPVSQTFHGRDVFAPVAAWIGRGIALSSFGPFIEDFVRIDVPVDRVEGEMVVGGEVCSIDRFGNLITNIRASVIENLIAKDRGGGLSVRIQGMDIPLLTGGYRQAPSLFALVNSSNLLEIASCGRKASEILGCEDHGDKVEVTLSGI